MKVLTLLMLICGLALAGCGGHDQVTTTASAGESTPQRSEPASHTAAAEGSGMAMKTADNTMKENGKMEEAMFAEGCFWGVQATFDKVKGVTETAVGYSGGHMDQPTYKDVCGDQTGHAEVIKVTYDPSQVSYDQLLDVFWDSHDPTQVNRQGPDYGSQYRSAIFYYTPEQKAAAEASKERLQASGKYSRPIATEITPASAFWRAEEYHQEYLKKRGLDGCHF